MNSHKNARLGFTGRVCLVMRVLADGWTVPEAAAAFGLSAQSARKWVRRYRVEGRAGLRDRSSRPHRSPRQLLAHGIDRPIELGAWADGFCVPRGSLVGQDGDKSEFLTAGEAGIRLHQHYPGRANLPPLAPEHRESLKPFLAQRAIKDLLDKLEERVRLLALSIEVNEPRDNS